MAKIKNYERSVIKLGNSMAITFPQEWFINTPLKEHSKVLVYPINDDTLVIHRNNFKEGPSILKLDVSKWPSKLIEQVILTAFKLNIEELFLNYNFFNKQDYYDMVNKLQRELIGFDSSISEEKNEICIRFLLDSSKTKLPEILIEIFRIFKEFMENLMDESLNLEESTYLEKFSRKYYLGMRSLIGTLLKYPDLEISIKRPIIRTLGDRITILYSKELMDYAFQLMKLPKNILKKYSELLIEISKLYLKIIEKYNNINTDTMWEFQSTLDVLADDFKKIEYENNLEDTKIRGIIERYFTIFVDLLEITITRVIESEI